jgi:nuclease S1
MEGAPGGCRGIDSRVNNRLQKHRPFYRCAANLVFAAALWALLSPAACWAWGGDGHQITALIAADHLNAAARAHVAQILGVPDDAHSVSVAMAHAALVPDTKYRGSAPETVDWHFVNLCRQDTPAEIDARCPNGACLPLQLDRFTKDLRSGKPDGKWDSAAQLEFVINFMGEIHQPMHAITNGDQGGKCLGVVSPESANALHSLWGERMVLKVEHELHADGPAQTAAALQRRFPDTNITLASPRTIAWESHLLAERKVYQPLQIALQPCQPTACIKQPAVKISRSYLDKSWPVAARRLATGGYRLAELLNTIWKQ